MLTGLTWPSLAESLYNFCSTLVAFGSFVLCFLDDYNIALCNDELYLVEGGPASGSIILNVNDRQNDYETYLLLVKMLHERNIFFNRL